MLNADKVEWKRCWYRLYYLECVDNKIGHTTTKFNWPIFVFHTESYSNITTSCCRNAFDITDSLIWTLVLWYGQTANDQIGAWVFSLLLSGTSCWTAVEVLVIWDTLTLMWHYCNEYWAQIQYIWHFTSIAGNPISWRSCKTLLRPSYLHNGIPYTGKMTSLYQIRNLVIITMTS